MKSVFWFWAALLIKLTNGFPNEFTRMNVRQDSWKKWYPTKVYGPEDWIMIQHRKNVEHKLHDFDKNWKEYVNGFGAFGSDSYWLGLENIHQATKKGKWELLLSIRFMDSTRGADFIILKDFKVESAVFEYIIRVNHTPTKKDVNNNLAIAHLTTYFDGLPFSTTDRDNDATSNNCARIKWGGWWFNNCGQYCLNCEYVDSTKSNKVTETFMGMREIKTMVPGL